ncbi:MAG: disulfide bond formation protein B [Magnetococcales bacterium]|nr:disulfide bond formation protein B [Magnetococcales bacterium]
MSDCWGKWWCGSPSDPFLLPGRCATLWRNGSHPALDGVPTFKEVLLSEARGENNGSFESAQPGWTLLFLAWILAAGAMLGSLFFSEVMGVPVCSLCWYQRIALYPLALILPMGLFPYDPKVARYVAPLVAVGWLIALFQVLLVAGIIPESAQPCVQGVPCSETYFALFGLFNIPTLSLGAFTLMGGLLFFAQRTKSS